jgi:hypothetical protein
VTQRVAARGLEDALQFQLDFDQPPRTAEELHRRLVALGLKGIAAVRLTENRAVMVSFSGGELRVHRGYLEAPPEVLRAIAGFVCGRTRAERRAAQRAILGFQIAGQARLAVRRPEPVRADDLPLVREFAEWHRHYNERHFGSALRSIPIRVSGRMRTRLGQYTAASAGGEPAEIAISRRHIRRHGWAEALHTLLHEMVHQWQAEAGMAIDHGPLFRAKARAVGIAPHARREICPAAKAGRVVTQPELVLRAARQD